MMPALEAIVARRVQVNFRADPAVVRALVPAPLEVAVHRGAAVVGVCLIRLSQLRPRGLPGFVGIASENMVHRAAVLYPAPDGPRGGVFVWQRHSDNAFFALLGGRAYPGVHHRARFHAVEGEEGLTIEAFTGRSRGDVSVSARHTRDWTPTALFPSLDEAAAVLGRGDRMTWSTAPLAVREARVAFFEDRSRFPKGSVAFDGAVVMRADAHEWRDLSDIAELVLPDARPADQRVIASPSLTIRS